MTPPDGRITGRGRWMRLGGLIGALATGTPYLVYVIAGAGDTPPKGGADALDAFQRFVIGTGYASLPGMAAGMWLAQWFTTIPSHRHHLFRYVPRGALIGALVWAFIFALSRSEAGPWSQMSRNEQILRHGVTMLVFTLIGAAIGAFCSTEEAKEAEGRLRDGVGGRREELEAAIEGKFGPLDEGRRTAIRGWDDGRLSEARRRLDDAKAVEDLGI